VRNLSRADVTEVCGIAVTTPLRTAWDLGRVRWPDEAISGLDALFRLRAFGRDEFLAGIERFRGMRWVTTLRAMGPLADGRSESPGESVLRIRCLEVNLRVVPQVEVWDHTSFLGRLDLADEELCLGLEYDGLEWHHSAEQLRHDRERRSRITSVGWTVRALGSDAVFGRDRCCDQIIRAAVREARERRTRRTAGRA
jgi:very-short-patch-repair endonuclease